MTEISRYSKRDILHLITDDNIFGSSEQKVKDEINHEEIIYIV